MKDFRSLEQKIIQLVQESNRNTELRKKEANVGRPEHNNKDETSKLSRNAEIKTKIIDEDNEYGMARNELETAKRAIDRLEAKMGSGSGELEAWVQAKITKASDYLDTVADYLESGSVKEEAIDEAGRVLPDLTQKEPEKKHSKEYLSRMPKKRESQAWKAYVRTGASWAKPNYVKEETIEERSSRKIHVHHVGDIAHVKDLSGNIIASYNRREHGEHYLRRAHAHIGKIHEDAVAGVSTKDSAKEQPETLKNKKFQNKDLMEPGTIKGGKTEVDLDPSTDDRDDEGRKETDKSKVATRKANREGGIKEGTMDTTKNFGLPADLIATVAEALKGNQKKIDKNHNGKIDGQDFKILRKEEVVDEERMSKGRRDALARKTSFTADPPRRLEKPEPKETKSDKMKAYRADRDKHMEEEAIDEKNWIAGAVKHPGALHKQLHVPAGEKIPAGKLNAAAEKGGKLGQRARLAKTLKRMEEDIDMQESNMQRVDMKGKKCTSCKKGTYQETSQMDDMDGVVHCTKCGKGLKRHQKAQAKTNEGVEFSEAEIARIEEIAKGLI